MENDIKFTLRGTEVDLKQNVFHKLCNKLDFEVSLVLGFLCNMQHFIINFSPYIFQLAFLNVMEGLDVDGIDFD
jgi:hypothetical protein